MPANEKKAWSDDDDRLLVDLVKRHVELEKIAGLLGRTKRGISDRLQRHHGDDWAASGHPEAGQRPRPKEQSKGDLERLGGKIDGLTQSVTKLTAAFERLRLAQEGRQLSLDGGPK